jgi:hypothetical protein
VEKAKDDDDMDDVILGISKSTMEETLVAMD